MKQRFANCELARQLSFCAIVDRAKLLIERSGEGEQKVVPLCLEGPAEAIASIKTLRAYFQLTKPRIALLIVISTAVGFCYGITASFSFARFFNAVIGAALMAAGSAALNQWLERGIDAEMKRTRNRPLPAGIIKADRALVFGVALSLLGLLELWAFDNALTAGLGLLTSVGYLFVYTPLKRKNPICTTIGAIPGAMPPLMGFAAARGHLAVEAWVLFCILFLWQFPHFHAIAWMYREDYARAGIKMLAVVRPHGPALTFEILAALLLLVPFTLAPTILHMAGIVYFVAALILDLAFLYFGFQLAKERSRRTARGLLLASVIYIPVLFAFLVFDNTRFLI
jgi:protoheme IX farnesyltransferase